MIDECQFEFSRFNDTTLINADCFDVFPLIPNESIDAIITDLPYGSTN